jgi:hypothetical protein
MIRILVSFRALLFLGFALLPLFGLATTVRPPSFDRLVNRSDYIVRATVTGIKSERDPSGNNRKIHTEIQLQVHEAIAGTPPGNVALRMLGGRVGDDELVIEDAPRFEVGDTGFFFIRGNGRLMVPLVAMMHGFYPVTKDAGGREHVQRSDRSALRHVSEVEQPLADADARLADAVPDGGLSPGEFARQIRATRRNQP